jgi:putative flippase GtrA
LSRFLRFCVIGTIGFLVDVLIVGALWTWSPLDPFSARLISIGAALTVTWMLNRLFAFGPSSRPVAVEGARYGGVGFLSAAVNYTTYAALLVLAPCMPFIMILVLASAVALIFSFVGYSRLVFDR